MKTINFGSLNLDHVYRVPHTALTGETMAAKSCATAAGGKGLNQSVAIARAGGHVFHAGCVGEGGEMLEALLRESGVDVSLMEHVAAPQGHAIIQVNDDGDNAMIIFGGSNRQVTRDYVDRVLTEAEKGDWVVLQNEISQVDYILSAASALAVTVSGAAPSIPRRETVLKLLSERAQTAMDVI